jgi:hypothetical protein
MFATSLDLRPVGLDHLLRAFPRAHHMLASLGRRKLLENVENGADIKRLVVQAHRAGRETALRGIARKTEACEPMGLPKRKEAPLDELARPLCEPYRGRC